MKIIIQSIKNYFKSKKDRGLEPVFFEKIGDQKTSRDEMKKNLIKALEKNGAFGIVLECTYSDISKKISNLIKIPTIGIGASVYCDGQVLVTDDIIGLTDAKIKFVKKYVDIKKIINSAVLKFKQEVKSKKYPTKKYSY